MRNKNLDLKTTLFDRRCFEKNAHNFVCFEINDTKSFSRAASWNNIPQRHVAVVPLRVLQLIIIGVFPHDKTSFFDNGALYGRCERSGVCC